MHITQARTRGRTAALAGVTMASLVLVAGCSNGSSSSATSSSTSGAAATSAAVATSKAAATSAAAATTAVPSGSASASSAPASSAGGTTPSGAASAPVTAAAPSNSSTLPGSVGFSTAKQTGGGITVWVDATRVPAVKAFQKAHPNIKVTMVTYDGAANGTNSFQTKMNLFDKAGNGWPDVVWSTQDNDASWASQKDGCSRPSRPPWTRVCSTRRSSPGSRSTRSTPAPSAATSTACATTWRPTCSGTTPR